MRSLGDITTIVNGTTPESGNMAFWGGHIVWITPVDLGKLSDPEIRGADRLITRAGLKSCNLTLVPVGTVVLSSRAPIGHLGIAAIELCTNQGCKSFVPGPEIDSRFLYYALKQSIWKLQRISSGATFNEVSKSQCESFEIPLPPTIDEQRRIATILSEQIAAVEQARAAAQARLEAVKALPAAFLRRVFPKSDEPLPDGWRWVKLEDVCRDVSDGTHFTPHYVDQGIPFLSVKDVREEGISFEYCRYITGEEHRRLCRRCKPERGDVLYTKVGTTGIAKAIDMEKEFSIFVSVALLKLRPSIKSSYLEKVLNSPTCRTQAENLTQGMANRNLVLKDLKKITVPLAPLSEQSRITTMLREQMRAVEKAREAAELELKTMNTLSAAILRRAFNGEL